MKLRKNGFFVVQEFMISDLGLKGNELLVYAIIHGFSQIKNQYFTGSLNYLMSWTGGTDKKTILKVLNSLIEKGLLEKEEVIKNNVKYCRYRIIRDNEETKVNKEEVSNTEVVEKIHQGSGEIPPNNIDIIYKDNIDNNIDTSFATQKQKKLFEENLVFLKEKDNNFVSEKAKRKNNNELINYIKTLKITQEYKNKFIEFYEYRRKIKKSIKTTKAIDFILNQKFENEEHAISCIDFAMGNEYIGVRAEYVDYKKLKKEKEPAFIELVF